MHVTTIGLDLAKNVFQVHGVTDSGEVVFNRALRRAQVLAFFERLDPGLIGIEACSTSHYWARELIRLGHEAPEVVEPIGTLVAELIRASGNRRANMPDTQLH